MATRIKVDSRTGNVRNVTLTPQEEARLQAEWAQGAAEDAAREAAAPELRERETLARSLADSLILGTPVNPQDRARYQQLLNSHPRRP